MDIRQAITDQIIELMEKGGPAWSQSWSNAALAGAPANARTGARYNGINVLLLLSAAARSGYTSNKWLTFKQAADLGAKVRKGEKAVMCCYFEMVKKKGEATESGDDEAGFFPLCKPFWLFNVAQIDDLPQAIVDAIAPPVVREFTAIETAERVAVASGAVIRHGGDRAFFHPLTDRVQMPEREQFISPANYYATLMHELTHWTGGEARLHRVFGKRFGDSAYAFEELVAELGASFVMGHLGLAESTLEGHAAYLDSWLQVLKADKTAIFTAAKHAGQAYEFLMTRAGMLEAKAAEQ